MRFKKICLGLPYKLLKKLIAFRLLEPVAVESPALDEDELKEQIPSLIRSADEYFQNKRADFTEEMKKPFVVESSTPNLLARLGWVLSELVYKKDLIVLDFGCGLGWLSHHLNRLQFNVIGLDVSKTAVEYARDIFAKLPYYNPTYNYHFIQYDGYTFPISDSSVHFIITFDSFHHVLNQKEILKEMLRVIVPGGKLILSEPGLGHTEKDETIQEVDKYKILERDTNILELEKKALDAGFENIFIKPFYNGIEDKWSRREYRKFFKGYINLNQLYLLRRSILSMPLIICQKSGSLEKSFYHQAEIKPLDKKIECRAGKEFKIKFRLINTGYLTMQSRKHPNGGYITIDCQVKKDESSIPGCFQARTELRKDLLPGEDIILEANGRSPGETGSYRIKIEPVYENIYWLSDRGNDHGIVNFEVVS